MEQKIFIHTQHSHRHVSRGLHTPKAGGVDGQGSVILLKRVHIVLSVEALVT
jgi:hypothetical protein